MVAGAARLWEVFASLVRARMKARSEMHGVVSKIRAVAGKRRALADILLAASDNLPGCLIYAVGLDAADQDLIIVSEPWASANDHAASLKLTSVQAAIKKARPLMAGAERLSTGEIIGVRGSRA